MNLYEVRHSLVSRPLADVAGEVRRRLDALDPAVPRGEVAVTAGSRGIAAMPLILGAVGDWLRKRGARPFLAPCMGSHGGATAEGQRGMLAALGITEQAAGMPIRSSMDVVELGTASAGGVFMDRQCFEAAGVVVVNRVKLHTSFGGPVQSGLTKMMAVGMGKIDSARTFHAVPTGRKGAVLVEMGRMVAASGKILAGLAVLEDGCHQVSELHAVSGADIPAREPELLKRHRELFPRLPADELNVLVVDEIGKCFSGTGMDTNVIGRRGIWDAGEPERPRIRAIAALGLAAASHGNAIGVGLADFVTRRLRDAMDETATLTNVLTTGEMQRMKIPATIEDDQALVNLVLNRFGPRRWMFVPNTLELERLYVSTDLADALRRHPRCTVADDSVRLSFRDGRCRLWE